MRHGIRFDFGKWIAALLLVTSLALAGCGGDNAKHDAESGADNAQTAAKESAPFGSAPADETPASSPAMRPVSNSAAPSGEEMEGEFFTPPDGLNLPALDDWPHPGSIAGLDGPGRLADSDSESPDEVTATGGRFTLETLSDDKSKDDAKPKKKPAETWKPAQVVPNSSRLTVGDDDELPFKGQQASVRIDGFRARVVLDMFFENDRDRQLEGNFQIRLPEGASLYYLAFGETEYEAKPAPIPVAAFFKVDDDLSRGLSPADITDLRQQSWNQPKVARVVPKEKAAHAYRETVRRRVDPALAEWSGAGVFSARVFPLAPKKLHRIVIGYDVNVLSVGDDRMYRLDLPKSQSTVVDINVSSFDSVNRKVAVKPAPARTTARDNRVLFHYENPDEQSIIVRLPGTQDLWLTGTDAEAGPFMAAEFTPNVFASPEGAAIAESQEKVSNNPSHAVFMLDTSLSSNPNRFPIWLKLLKANLDESREELKFFNVACFNIEAYWYQNGWVQNTPENVAKLMEYCDNLALEGATNLGRALQFAARGPAWNHAPKQPDFDVFLLSDGAGTWGEADLYALSQALGERTLFAYTTGMAGTDVRTLAHLARESGGAVFAVTGEDQLTAAAKAHHQRPWQIESVKIDGISDVLLAGRPTALFPGQKLTVVGRGELPKNAQLVLTLKQGKTVKELKIAANAVLDSELTPRVYGQVAVDQLEGFKSATEEFAAAYARHFRVPGQTCSLLMLDTEEDYLRYNIKPENDVVVVSQQPANTIVDDVLEEVAEQLGNPKVEFLNWLAKLEKMPGVEFEQSAALQVVLKQLPRESFDVKPPALECALRNWDSIPGPLQEQLATQKLDYGILAAEADRRLKTVGAADALRALSSLVEIRPGDAVTARDVGFTAMEYGMGAEAYALFRRVADNRPWEPQTYHAMARCLEELEQADLAVAYYEVALGGKWNPRFGEFRQIVSMDYLRLLRRIDSDELATKLPDVFINTTLARLNGSPVGGEHDLVVTIMWNTDGTDVDLHIKEPTGEVCMYSHPRTKIGGQLTQDVTQGFGPEMYRLTTAKAGEYRIWAHYFANDANRTGTRTRVYANVYRNWGRPNEQVTRTALTLKGNKNEHDIARIKWSR